MPAASSTYSAVGFGANTSGFGNSVAEGGSTAQGGFAITWPMVALAGAVVAMLYFVFGRKGGR